MTEAFDALSRKVGILPDYIDFDGVRHPTREETQRVLLRAMGLEAGTAKAARETLKRLEDEDDKGSHPRWCVVEEGRPLPRALVGDDTWHIACEDGSEEAGKGPGNLPVMPLGRHVLSARGRKTWLLSAPAALPGPPRSWGLIASLAGLRSATEGGMGSYRDLAKAASAFGRAGADFLGINPVHAGFPTDETAFSPYSPSHRRWLNTIHIDTGMPPVELGEHVAFEAEIKVQQAVLRPLVDAIDPQALGVFTAQGGEALRRFALHQALSDRFGPYWDRWPEDLRSFQAPGIAAIARDLEPEIRFHAGLQYLAETQLLDATRAAEAAGMRFGLYLDLAVGAYQHGAETWENRALYAQGASLGAPPDHFTPDGQNWTLSPFVPRALEAEGFASFAAILRQQFRFAKLLRIDHILGFERAFWALDEPGVPGAYVRMPREALLAVTRIEAARAGATVVGEDLGNIPTGLQDALRQSGLLGYRLMVFEHDVANGRGFREPARYPAQTLASFSTHDLPTWEGWRKARDLEARQRLGASDEALRARAIAQRDKEVAALDAALEGRDMHAFLAECASSLVAVQVENVFGVEDQLNLPGTVHEYPNWRGRLPLSVDAASDDRRLQDVARLMHEAGR